MMRLTVLIIMMALYGEAIKFDMDAAHREQSLDETQRRALRSSINRARQGQRAAKEILQALHHTPALETQYLGEAGQTASEAPRDAANDLQRIEEFEHEHQTGFPTRTSAAKAKSQHLLQKASLRGSKERLEEAQVTWQKKIQKQLQLDRLERTKALKAAHDTEEKWLQKFQLHRAAKGSMISSVQRQEEEKMKQLEQITAKVANSASHELTADKHEEATLKKLQGAPIQDQTALDTAAPFDDMFSLASRSNAKAKDIAYLAKNVRDEALKRQNNIKDLGSTAEVSSVPQSQVDKEEQLVQAMNQEGDTILTSDIKKDRSAVSKLLKSERNDFKEVQKRVIADSKDNAHSDEKMIETIAQLKQRADWMYKAQSHIRKEATHILQATEQGKVNSNTKMVEMEMALQALKKRQRDGW